MNIKVNTKDFEIAETKDINKFIYKGDFIKYGEGIFLALEDSMKGKEVPMIYLESRIVLNNTIFTIRDENILDVSAINIEMNRRYLNRNENYTSEQAIELFLKELDWYEIKYEKKERPF